MRILIDTNILFSALLFPGSGDKDFLSLDLEHPKCMTAAQFLEEEGAEF